MLFNLSVVIELFMDPYGGSGGSPFVSARPECALSYLSGNAKDRLDSLTLHYEC